MSVRNVINRGMTLARSVFQTCFGKPAVRVAAKVRGEGFRVGPPVHTVQPRTFLPSRYRYYRTSLSGLAAQLHSGSFRRMFGSPRNRAVFLAFGLGVGLIEQQLEDDRRSTAACQEIQALFSKKTFQNPLKHFTSGYKLEDYVIGKQIGKGCNAAVYEAAASFAVPRESRTSSLVRMKLGSDDRQEDDRELRNCSVTDYPLAVKMMWNIGPGSSSDSILSAMSHELVPAGPLALKERNGAAVVDGYFGDVPRRVSAHPNVITLYRAFTAEVPLLPGAKEEYPDVLPTRLNPAGLGRNHTLFLVMKNYPCTLGQFLEDSLPCARTGSLMVLQLLEGVDHLCRHGIAHRDLKSDNILLEFDSGGNPRLVITDFGCCLAERDCELKLPFNSRWVNRGGNSALMAPEIATAIAGPSVVIDYSKADAWAVGAISYEIFGQPNPFYGRNGLDSSRYQEWQLPPLPHYMLTDTQVVVKLLLRRNPKKRPSARVAANMLHLSLWGAQSLADRDIGSTKEMADWLLCRSAVALLTDRYPNGSTVEMELQKSFLSNVTLEELRTSIAFLLFGREKHMFQSGFA
ncbi:serine/threonine-protein kinase PINK1, mitochondrial [Paramormyrops kingsleyae]|uniref:serine/threonine-protein kinase PINK1, mitochondrial n=1 Tax=Paramormyrops kingsleyae TaxID=1676925 RepID=UPI003B96B31F